MEDLDFENDAAYITCECRTVDHMLVVMYDSEDDVDDYLIFTQMNHYMGFFRRLYHGVRYIMGLPAKRCHFAETVVNAEKFERRLARLASKRMKVINAKS